MSCFCRSSLPTCPQYSEVKEKYAQIFHILRKLTELLESELLSCLTGREFELFDHYFSMVPQAHFVNDLPFVCRLLELIPEKMYINEVFEEYYEKYLVLCGVPPLMLYSSESLTCNKDLEEFFSVLGGLLLYLKKTRQTFILLESITNILSGKIEYPRCYVSLGKLQLAAANSLLPKIIGRFLSFATDEMYERLLQISVSLAKASDLACYKMIEEGAVDSLLTHLNPTCTTMGATVPPLSDLHLCHYEESSTLIWLLLKSLKGSTAEDISKLPSPSRFAFWSLRFALKYFYTNKRSRIDRNNIVAILLKIVQIFPTTEFVQSGLARDIIELNLVVENDTLINDWSGIQITPSMEDFVFIRLLLMFLYFFNRPEYYGGIHFLRDTSIIGLKMKLVTHSQAVKWHTDHLGALISIVISVFAQTASYTVEIFLAEKGIIKFMEILLEKKHNIDVYLSLLRSLIIMGRMDKIKSRMILNRLLDIRAQFTLMGYCESIISKEVLDSKNQLSVAYSFAIIEKLYKCKTNLSNKRLMDLSIAFLKRIRSPWEQDPFIIPQLPIMIISCLWNILLCDEQNLKQFIHEEGIYICLDLAETCVYPVKVVAFGLLTEVCEESLAVPFFITWRGAKHQKILPFLLEIFREENRILGAKHTTGGLIEDIELPLMGLEQYKNICDPKNSLHASPSISDMIGSCRPKIYAILDMLTCVHEERVRMADDVYKTWNQDLSIEDQITKVIAENFFALKIAEVWDEIQLHFERCGVRPLANDHEMLSLVLNRAKKWGAFIQATQREILRSNRENEMIIENSFYMDLREARLGQTLGACCELEYIARCTREIYRIRTKRKHNLHLMEFPVKKTDPNILYHTTFMYDIMVNPIFDQILHIANINNTPTAVGQTEKKGPMTARMRKAMQKYQKAKFEKMPSTAEDQLWGSISDETCITK
ncbi:cilia- and flagella-associated protein 69-like [Coccinella septempunctata]|uniref:cilia- and flagella-associated protein 69-like n=1 Tax=Coccinella septempunctata TaxID=41139 RepID=UPI001D06A095|nr:cilia- and flagella-associated protein 69-like [Coccinella septempunctata]